MNNILKVLYKKDKQTALKVAEVFGYKITKASETADAVFEQLSKQNSLAKYLKKDALILTKEFQLTQTQAKKLFQKLQDWDKNITDLMKGYGLSKKDAQDAYNMIIKKYKK